MQAGNDKIVKTIVKKVGAHPLGVDEINFFRDDNTILHFKNPEAYASIQNNTFIVSGEPETKTVKDLLPDIIQQLGPKQSKLLQELVSSIPQNAEEVPDLVESAPTPAENLDSVEWPWSMKEPYLNQITINIESKFRLFGAYKEKLIIVQALLVGAVLVSVTF